MNIISDEELCEIALKATENSYVPYSGFHVGAALLCADGTVISGCNIENASYGLTNCAERTAIFKAISEGKSDFSKIAITAVCEGESRSALPCGACRQVMAEFCEKSFQVLIYHNGEIKYYTLEDLLPHSFDL